MCTAFETIIEPPIFLTKCFVIEFQKHLDIKQAEFQKEFKLPLEQKWT
jgi:hypothetical protein